MTDIESKVLETACSEGSYCPKCDDAYTVKLDSCPACETDLVHPIPKEFYENHPECFEVAMLIYEEDVPDNSDVEQSDGTKQALDEAVELLTKLRDPEIDGTGTLWIDAWMHKHREVIGQ